MRNGMGLPFESKRVKKAEMLGRDTRYSCGMYGGSFNPLHLGHVRCLLTAANRCRRLIVVLFHGVNRSEIDISQRYRWVYEAVRHLPHVELFVLEDEAAGTKEYLI